MLVRLSVVYAEDTPRDVTLSRLKKLGKHQQHEVSYLP